MGWGWMEGIGTMGITCVLGAGAGGGHGRQD